ncbi:autotransporter domain-containing protein [Cupriavidus sp. USMAA2-4]|uniref:autotransporter domain-containing protein n=1 Tax=Cupriavidus sp. USMAA2-4 TaxID=876364 RepID=UPI0009FBCBD2|nr:autotransporter domain-containing protein [Cupriavidus sp. USMAA2-4]
MNHTYRIIFNRSIGIWQAVSEVAKGHSKNGRSQCRSLALAIAVGGLLVHPAERAMAQVYAGNEVVHGPFADGKQLFLENSRLEADEKNAIRGGEQTFRDESRLDINAAHALTGGVQRFHGNSVLQSSVSNAITGGEQSFHDNSAMILDGTTISLEDGIFNAESARFTDNSKLDVRRYRGMFVGTLDFSGASTLTVSETNGILGKESYTPSARPPKLTFRDQSTFNINAQNAVLGTSTARPGTEGEEYLPASIAFLDQSVANGNAENGLWDATFYGNSVAMANATRAITSSSFFDKSTLNLNAERAAAYIYMRGRSIMNANVAEALGSEGGYSPAFEFHDNSTLNANAAQAVSARPRFYDDSKFVLASENSLVESAFVPPVGGIFSASVVDFYDNSTMEINAPRAIGPGGYEPNVAYYWDGLAFRGNSTLNLNGEDVLRTANRWNMDFWDNATFNINAAQNFHDGREPLRGASVYMSGGTINANVADSIYGGFYIRTLNAKAAEAVSGGRIYVRGNLNALVPRAITGGQQTIEWGALHAMATHAVDGGRIVGEEDGRIEVEAHNALSTNAVIEFGTEYTNGGMLNLNGHSTTIGKITSIPATAPWAKPHDSFIQNTGADDAALVVDGSIHGDSFYSGQIRDGGAGRLGIVKTGASTLTLNGANTYSGPTEVRQGTLLVGDAEGVDASVASAVSVASDSTLGGHGSVGSTTVAAAGILAPGGAQGGTLTVNGDLTLASGSIVASVLGAPGASGSAGQSGSVRVHGDLTLEGATVNTSNAGGLGVGLYRLFDYDGILTQRHGGLVLGASPAGSSLSLQYLDSARQINLVNSSGATLNFWNANGAASATQLGGGSGIWSNASPMWADAMGTQSGPMQPKPGFAIFSGERGEVTLSSAEGTVQARGIQFATDGYTLRGDALHLVADGEHPAPVEIRVGDGSAAGAQHTATIDAVIAGTDGLNKTGAGTLVLTAANTYSGGNKLSAGTLAVSADTALGASDNGLHFNGGALRTTADMATVRSVLLEGRGTFDTQMSTVLDLKGDISGNGVLEKTGAGTLKIARANDYQGGTSVQAGTLAAGATGALGSGPVRVTGSGSLLRFEANADAQALSIHNDHGGTTSFSEQTSAGTAAIVNQGQGATVFSAQASAGEARMTNEFQGSILLRDQASADTARIANKAGGRVDISGLTSAGTAIGALSGEGAVFLGSKTLTIGGLGHDSVLGGVIADGGEGQGTGGSLVKTGAGKVILDGSNTYTGTTTVSAGTLVVGQHDGSWAQARVSGPVHVAEGAKLAGYGTVGSTVVDAHGILSPGYYVPSPGSQAANPGSLKIAGDLTMLPGSTLELASNCYQSTRISASGKADLQGGTALHTGTDFKANHDYTILTADGGVNGKFDQVKSDFAILEPNLTYTPTAVLLRFGQSGRFASLAQSPNQRAVARALDSLPTNSELYQQLLTMPNGAPPGVFNSLSGEAHASLGAVLHSGAGSMRTLSLNHLRNNLSASPQAGATASGARLFSMHKASLNSMRSHFRASPEADTTIADAGTVDAPDPGGALPVPEAQPFWAEVSGGRQIIDGTSDTAGIKQSLYGISVGADGAVGDGWRVGGTLGFTDSSIHTDARASKASVKSYGALLYGGKAFEAGSGKLNLMMGGGYTWHGIDTERKVAGAGLDQTLTADYGAGTGQLFAEIGYALPVRDATVEPFAGIAWSDTRTRGFSESGGSAALDGQRKRDNQTSTTLGVRGRTPFELGAAKGSVTASLGWRHALGSVTPESTLAFRGSETFTVTGTPIARNAALIEVGGEVAISRNATLSLGYAGQHAGNNREHRGRLNLRWGFH